MLSCYNEIAQIQYRKKPSKVFSPLHSYTFLNKKKLADDAFVSVSHDHTNSYENNDLFVNEGLCRWFGDAISKLFSDWETEQS